MKRITAELIKMVTRTDIEISEGEERVDMCLAIEQMKEESRREGEKSGRLEGAEKMMEMLGVPKEEWGKYLSMLKEDSEVYGE